MKKILFLFILCISFCGFSQEKRFSIDWEGEKTISTGSFNVKVPAFNSKNFEFNFDKGLQFIAEWKVNRRFNEENTKITNISYSSISSSDLLGVDKKTIPNKVEYKLSYSKARQKQFAVLQLSPIIKDENGNYKKITSFTVSYNESTSRNSRITRNRFQPRTIVNSALADGDWYKFYVDTTGVFRLTKSFLDGLGVNTNSIDPRNIKLYGNGGRMIPYRNDVAQPFDVTENAIKVVGEEDGVFNNEDYILFYAVGPKNYHPESNINTNINVYTERTYYYINVSSGAGKRIQPFMQPSGAINMTIDSFDDYTFHEVDEFNLANVGRRWFGDRFDIENEKQFNFQFPDLITSEPLNLKVYVASTGETATTMNVSVNGSSISTLNLPAASDPNLVTGATYIGNVNVSSSDVMVTLTYNNGGNPSAIGYLDYISIEATRALNFNNQQFLFKKNDVVTTSGIGQYNITNTSQLQEIWDVTDIFNVTNTVNTDAASNFSFTSNLGELREYVTVTSSDYFEPQRDNVTTVQNQNLKGTIFNNVSGVFQDIDYIIITPENMLSQAERLAQINRNQYQLNVKVVTLPQIYNEFSTGNSDIGAIRNLVKYVYDNASSPDNRIKYLCLLGDASFDYKDRIPNNTNVMPSWHAYNSFNLTNAFISDDFFGMMDDNEGDMSTSDKLDIAVGRIIADTPQRAKEMVDKVESYYAKEAFGSWRNNFIVVSDDVDLDWEGIIQETTDNIGNMVSTEKPFINTVKVHMDAFQQQTSAGGERYPKATEALVNAIENGALVINYFGHGGEEGLAQERILDKPTVQDFGNVCKLNCFVTVTCEYTKFDNPFRETAGEFTYWNKEGGAIGLITTTRQIFVSTGITLNNVLEQYLFSFSDNDTFEDHEYPSMAEALRLTKNDPSLSSRSQRRLVFFIGDPAMKLAFPQPNIRLTTINGAPISGPTDVLEALSYAKLGGEVTDVNGNLLTNYNGTLSVTIYDKKIQQETLANDGTRLNGTLIKLDFETLGEVIFRGQASVANGLFEFDFIVPRDIGIPVGYGRVSFYAQAENSQQDQTGYSINTVQIGGLNANAEEDNIGPTINLFMNDESFVSGGITNESPTLLAKLEDENGINTASGIGHDIVAILDGDETNPFILNDYYQTDVDVYQSGTVSFPFRDLEPGLHTLTFKAWDVYNNSSVSEIQFVVHDEDQELVINNVLNYPNPFVNYTEFWFNHNSSEVLDVSVQIFTVSGKLVKTINGQTTGGAKVTSSLSRDLIWDGRDDFGDRIGKGVYVYKLTVKSPTSNKKVDKIEKLVIL